MDREEILRQVRGEKEKIRGFGVESILLTGSYARDEATADSDIDFVVSFKEGRGGVDDYLGLLHFLEDLLDREIDLVKEELIRDELRPSLLDGDAVEAAV